MDYHELKKWKGYTKTILFQETLETQIYNNLKKLFY